MKTRGRIVAIVLPLMVLPSCGRKDGPPLYPVHGKVIYKGAPAAGATVILRRLDPEPNTTPLVPIGQADEEGNFWVTVEELGDGAPAGKYAALVEWRTKAEGAEAAKAAEAPKKKGRYKVVPRRPDGVPDRLAGRYMIAEKSPFRIEVKDGDNAIDPFDISN